MGYWRLHILLKRAGVAINPGAEWMTDAVGGRKRLRLCFAHPTHEVIREGVAGTPMPPWAFEIAPDEAVWLAGQLMRGDVP